MGESQALIRNPDKFLAEIDRERDYYDDEVDKEVDALIDDSKHVEWGYDKDQKRIATKLKFGNKVYDLAVQETEDGVKTYWKQKTETFDLLRKYAIFKKEGLSPSMIGGDLKNISLENWEDQGITGVTARIK